MIFVALGANLPSERFGSPRRTLEAALARMADRGLGILRRSSWYESAAVPPSDQPNFVNGVAEIATGMDPRAVMRALHDIEAEFGRERRIRWEARVVDLDLIAYDDRVIGYGADGAPAPDAPFIVPHPRMHERRFVLAPLAELAPGWRHPVIGRTARDLLSRLPADDAGCDRLPERGDGSAADG